MADALANEQIEPPTPEPTSRLLADSAAYSPAEGFVDEVFDAPGSARVTPPASPRHSTAWDGWC